MTVPRITVIMPNYNRGEFLERTICSVLDQDYDNLQFIVIDEGSVDDSVNVIRYYEDALDYWRTQPHTTRGDAIQQGLAHATGEIVGILNSDDLYPPGALSEVGQIMKGPDAPSWLVGRCFRIGEHDEMIGAFDASAPSSLATFLMRDSGQIPAPASFVNRSCIDRVGSFANSFQYAFDYDCCCRLLAHDIQPVITSQVLGMRREFADTKSALAILQEGLEYIAVASRYATHLPLRQRYELWSNIDRRRRIYALAENEVDSESGTRFLLDKLIRHPWWLTDNSVRHVLLHGVEHAVPTGMLRSAA